MKNKKVFLPEYDKVEELRDEHDYLDTSGETFYLLTKIEEKVLPLKMRTGFWPINMIQFNLCPNWDGIAIEWNGILL